MIGTAPICWTGIAEAPWFLKIPPKSTRKNSGNKIAKNSEIRSRRKLSSITRARVRRPRIMRGTPVR